MRRWSGSSTALSEYDIRRPLTATGTNLLGLVKHMATWEARYFGEVFGRPFPEPLGRWQDADGSDLWVTPDETREQIIGFYQRAWEACGRDDRRASHRRARPRAVVAAARRQAVQHHGPRPSGDHPACRARRHPA